VEPSGLPDFSWHSIPRWEKIYQNDQKYTKWAYKYQMTVNRPNGQKYINVFLCKNPPKLTQIGIFGSKIHHLATLMSVTT
jgi:hypothetical protein